MSTSAALRDDDPNDPWEADTYSLILETLKEIQEMLVYVQQLQEDDVSETMTLQDFAEIVHSQQWSKIHQRGLSSHGTRARPFVSLSTGWWEAEKPVFSDGCDLSAMIS